MPPLCRRNVEEIWRWHLPCSLHGMVKHPVHVTDDEEPTGAEGVPVDAPDNTAPAISPQAVSRMPRAEDDEEVARHNPDVSDEYLKPARTKNEEQRTKNANEER